MQGTVRKRKQYLFLFLIKQSKLFIKAHRLARQILKMESNNGSYIRKFNQGKQTKSARMVMIQKIIFVPTSDKH